MEVPSHLEKYVVEQNYDRYTPEDQAVWRYIMRRLKHFLSKNAHSCYSEGLAKTGIEVERIPRISDMDKKLREFGWGAVPVSGFIPPAAFMEFQSLGFLPIACDMRSLDHVLYTPAPDIVHEAAGHAPILIDPKFAEYLKCYAEVATKAIISHEDLELYEAIRLLSDVKENPESTENDIAIAETALQNVTASISYTSEAGYLGRMNWWTAEYGLIGELESPKIFGAGLLSSVGESKDCLSEKVRKIPLTIDCLKYSYDITEPQPQLFVTSSFQGLIDVLGEMSESMAYKRGGEYGVKEAIKAQTVNTVMLNSGLQISGQFTDYFTDQEDKVVFVKTTGPTQLCLGETELAGHGKSYHAHGYSTPVGMIKGAKQCLSEINTSDLIELGIAQGEDVSLEFVSGIQLKGKLESILCHDKKNLLFSFSNCEVRHGDTTLFQPEWGIFDMATASLIPSVCGGPADRIAYGAFDDFVARRVPSRNFSPEDIEVHQFYEQISVNRNRKNSIDERVTETKEMIFLFLDKYPEQWLLGIELLELAHRYDLPESTVINLTSHLQGLQINRADDCIDVGVYLSSMVI